MKRLSHAAMLAVALACALTGCASQSGKAPAVAEADMIPQARGAVRGGVSGGVFNPEAVPLTSDSRAFRVGDVVTVLLQETTQASKRAGTSINKGSSASVSPLGAFGKTFAKTGVELAADRGFSGDATSTQQNALSGAVTVIVQEVMSNGLLRVAGEKSLTLNQGEEFVRVKGFVRAGDIDNDNQVSSLRVANARITYSAKGALAEANSPGWLTRFFNGPFMPF